MIGAAAVAASVTLPSWAGRPWSGNGADNNWSTDGNWAANNTSLGDGRFFRSSAQEYTNKTVNFSASTSFSYHVYVDEGTSETNPVVWYASQSSFGLKSSKNLDIGCAVADGYLKILSGTYTCSILDLGKGGLAGMLTMDGGSFTNSNGMYVGDTGTGTLIVNDGATVFAVAKTFVGNESGAIGAVIVDGGTFTTAENVYIGYKGTGTLTINSGAFETSSEKYTRLLHGTSTITLNGGTLKTKHIEPTCPDSGVTVSAGGTLVFNGGTLYANAVDGSEGGLIRSGVTVKVIGGGVIDNGNLDISIAAALGVSGDGGGLVFTGGGTTTLNGAVNYSGETGVTPGTILAVANATAKSNILTNGLVLTGPPTADQTVMTFTSALTGSDLSKVKCSLAPTTTFKIGTDGNSIVVDVPGPVLDNYWTGAANDGDLSNAVNWSSGSCPTGNANIFSATPVTLTKGATFAPSAITFLSGSANVTIDGDVFTGVAAVTNLSSASHTINAPVYFSGNIQVKQDAMGGKDDLAKAHVTFGGGAYAASGCSLDDSALYSRCIFGKYYLANTTAEPWTATGTGNSRVCVANDSSLYVPNAQNAKQLYLSNGAKVVFGSMTLDASGYRPAEQNFGEIIVTNLTETGTGNRYMTYNQGTATPGVFKFGSVTNGMSDNYFYLADEYAASKHVFYIGEGGLNFLHGSVAYCLGIDKEKNYETIRPWHSDFTIAEGGDSSGALIIRRTVEFCTDDESGVGRTLTIDTKTRAQATPQIFVSGSGILKVNKPRGNNGAEPSVTVKDTATLAFKPGGSLGSGATTVNSGAVLAVAESGSVTLDGDLTLAEGATLAFNFTERNNAPTLAIASGKTVTANGTVNVKITAADGIRPKGGSHMLTTCGGFVAGNVSLDETVRPDWATGVRVEDGNIVVDVKPRGLIIFFQ